MKLQILIPQYKGCGWKPLQVATTAFVQEAIANIDSVQGVLYGN